MDVPDGVANFLAKCAQKVVEEPPPLFANFISISTEPLKQYHL
jgi:hypothetical protein